MVKKTERMGKITNYLRMQSKPSSVSEIHEALCKRMHMKVSRKTIERDMLEMADNKKVQVIYGTPSRFILIKPTEVDVCLKVEEVQELLNLLDSKSNIYIKLSKYI